MSVALEPVQTEEADVIAEPIAEVIAEIEKPIPEVEEPVAEIEEGIPDAVQPKKNVADPKGYQKRRQRNQYQKAVRMKPPSESSSDDDKLTHDDMETLLLDYLVKRKTSQQNARRQTWSQLAGSS